MTRITKESIETAYCFFHQKERVYAHSHSSTQKDDIEYAISDFVNDMNPALYQALSKGASGFLHTHSTFHADILQALDDLENMLNDNPPIM